MIILAIPMPIRKTSATAEIVVSSQYSVLSAPGKSVSCFPIRGYLMEIVSTRHSQRTSENLKPKTWNRGLHTENCSNLRIHLKERFDGLAKGVLDLFLTPLD